MQTKPRQVRVSDPLWYKAIRKGNRQGRAIPELVRGFLAEYTADEPDLTAEELDAMREASRQA